MKLSRQSLVLFMYSHSSTVVSFGKDEIAMSVFPSHPVAMISLRIHWLQAIALIGTGFGSVE